MGHGPAAVEARPGLKRIPTGRTPARLPFGAASTAAAAEKPTAFCRSGIKRMAFLPSATIPSVTVGFRQLSILDIIIHVKYNYSCTRSLLPNN
ncbi:hypothetical protein SL003B_0180 [Polymorphum gilvum SL003B-26A1]|uniref:Uncharacterized protein n=1 Tax=Polymorphum gilvum (strain LMG 25793 / CGMCC 1.9160 / SL003B-26A1) TaxID=991905 RepID=F2J084_POLGS|nr:hypothetical protein SL003B_0180 [Polymorphum gilvum SL003B-26A1]